MTVRSTYRKRHILPGFLVALLIFIGQTTATPTQATPSNSSGISTDSLDFVIGQVTSSPHNPRQNDDASSEIINVENDDDPLSKSIPVHAVDHYLFEHVGESNSEEHLLHFPVAAGIRFHLTAIYMLTERFRL
jgi:hypothetical protein